MNATELPQVHRLAHLPTRDTGRRIRAFTDLPPAYSSLYAITNVDGIEEPLPRYESESSLLYNYSFEDKTTRIVFIQKVLAIKLLQLLGATAVTAVFLAYSWEIIRSMSRGNTHVNIVVATTIAFLVVYVLLVSCEKARRRNPWRYMFLVGYPLCLAAIFAIWTVYWQMLHMVLLAFIYYCVVVFVLLLYSIFVNQTNLQFTTKCGFLLAMGAQIVMFGITIAFSQINAVHLICLYVLMTLEYMYVVGNLSAMTSSDYWSDITPSNYVDGAINLHVDYFNFLYNWVASRITGI